MQFGLFSHGSDRKNAIPADTYDSDLEEIVAADELGYDEVWIAEHVSRTSPSDDFHFDSGGHRDNLSAVNPFIGMASAMTKRIRMGPGVRPLAWYQPLQVAIEANVCDQLSRGRYMLGIGTGGYRNNQMEQRGIGDEVGGLDPSLRGTTGDSERHERWHEAIEIIQRLWTATEPFDYEGRYYSGKRAWVDPPCFQKPHPPVGVAVGFTPSTADFTGEKGFWPIFSQYSVSEVIQSQSERYVDAARAAGHRMNRNAVRVTRYIYLADSDEKAKAELGPGIARALEEINLRFVLTKSYLRPGDPPEALDFDYLLEAGYILAGDPDTVYRRLAEDYERAGGFGVLLLYGPCRGDA